MTLGQRCIAMFGQQIDDIISTLGQPMIAIWEYSFQVSITYSITDYVLFYLYLYAKCHRNRLFLSFLGTYRISIYSLEYRLPTLLIFYS